MKNAAFEIKFKYDDNENLNQIENVSVVSAYGIIRKKLVLDVPKNKRIPMDDKSVINNYPSHFGIPSGIRQSESGHGQQRDSRHRYVNNFNGDK